MEPIKRMLWIKPRNQIITHNGSFRADSGVCFVLDRLSKGAPVSMTELQRLGAYKSRSTLMAAVLEISTSLERCGIEILQKNAGDEKGQLRMRLMKR